jgi:hypothetical protein
MTARNARTVGLCTASLLAMAVLLVSACATTGAPESAASPATTAAHAERVFRYQSRMADALLDHYPLFEAFAAADPELVAAEARMSEVCGPLTQAALARAEGGEPSLALRFEVLSTLDECERAARRIERMLSGTGTRDSPSI